VHKQKDFCLQKLEVWRGNAHYQADSHYISICIFIATRYNFHFRVLGDSRGQHLCKHSVDVHTATFIVSYPAWKHSTSPLPEMQLVAQQAGWAHVRNHRLQQHPCPIRPASQRSPITQLSARRGPGKAQEVIQSQRRATLARAGWGLSDCWRPGSGAVGALHLPSVNRGLCPSGLRMRAFERRHVTGHSEMLLITVWHSLHSQLQTNRSFFLPFLAAEGTVFTHTLSLWLSRFPSHPWPAASRRPALTPRAVGTGSHGRHHCSGSNNVAVAPNSSGPSCLRAQPSPSPTPPGHCATHGRRKPEPGSLQPCAPIETSPNTGKFGKMELFYE